MRELKPCPFCGGEATHGKYWHGWIVICSECGCKSVYAFSPEEAIDAWNRRVTDENI